MNCDPVKDHVFLFTWFVVCERSNVFSGISLQMSSWGYAVISTKELC